MSDKSTEQGAGSGEFREFSQEQKQSVLFAQLVMQQSNMAMMLLGKVPDPQSGETTRDLEAAKFFIDVLEVLEAKTKGNLSKEEEALLKQSLMALRLEFVAAVESPEPAAKPAEKSAAASPAEAAPPKPDDKTAPAESAGAAVAEESRKRYSKKFSL